MKKLLLSLAVVAFGAGSAAADEVTITIKGACDQFGDVTVSDLDKAADFSFTKDGFTLTTSKGTTTASAYNKAGDLRIYAGGTVTVAGAAGVTIDKVVFNISTAGLKRLAPVTADAGEIAAQAAGDNTVTWTGAANAVKFTVGEKADYGSDGNAKAGQLDFDSVTITYTASGVTKSDAGMAFEPNHVTLTLGDAFTAPALTKATDATPTYSTNNADVATVDAATGAVTILAVGDAVITATCAETDAYYAGTASYTITVKEALGENDIYKNDCLTSDCGFTSIYEGEINPWSIDSKYGLKASAYISNKPNASDAIMASPVLDLTNRKGATLSFQHAVNQFRLNGELINIAETGNYCSIVAREEGGEWTVVNGLTFPETYSWNFVDCESVDLNAYAGKKMQFGFRYISTAEIAGTWEIKNITVTGDKTSGNQSVSILEGEDTSVRYYNLQGVEVQNPQAGLYIRVAGSKTQKVIIR